MEEDKKMETEEVKEVVVDEIVDETMAKEMQEEKIESRKVEVETFKTNLEKATEATKYQKLQIITAGKLRKLQMEGDLQKLIKPQFKYQEDERFWELNKETLEYKDIMEKHLDKEKVVQMEKGLVHLQEQLDNAEKMLKEELAKVE